MMRLTMMIAGLLASGIGLAAARAENFTCHGAGRCVCTESVAAKAVLGYNATSDGQSTNVAITCINMNTMDVAYYTRRKENGLGGTYSSDPVPQGQ